MYAIHLQVKARADLKKIWRYSHENHGEKQADKYYGELAAGMEIIQRNPYIGVSCDYIRAGYRQYKVNEHYIFYRISNQKIHIIRVLHEAMQAINHL